MKRQLTSQAEGNSTATQCATVDRRTFCIRHKEGKCFAEVQVDLGNHRRAHKMELDENYKKFYDKICNEGELQGTFGQTFMWNHVYPMVIDSVKACYPRRLIK